MATFSWFPAPVTHLVHNPISYIPVHPCSPPDARRSARFRAHLPIPPTHARVSVRLASRARALSSSSPAHAEFPPSTFRRAASLSRPISCLVGLPPSTAGRFQSSVFRQRGRVLEHLAVAKASFTRHCHQVSSIISLFSSVCIRFCSQVDRHLFRSIRPISFSSLSGQDARSSNRPCPLRPIHRPANSSPSCQPSHLHNS